MRLTTIEERRRFQKFLSWLLDDPCMIGAFEVATGLTAPRDRNHVEALEKSGDVDQFFDVFIGWAHGVWKDAGVCDDCPGAQSPLADYLRVTTLH